MLQNAKFAAAPLPVPGMLWQLVASDLADHTWSSCAQEMCAGFQVLHADLRAVPQDFATDHPEHVHFMDLSASFLVRPASEIWANATDTARQEINETFMPDAQHPSAPGMRIVAAALEPLVRRLVSAAPDDMDAI